MPNATPIATVISIPANEREYMNYACIHSMILIHDLGIGSHIRGISFTHRKQLMPIIGFCSILIYRLWRRHVVTQTMHRWDTIRIGIHMMTSSIGNFFVVTGNLCGDFTGHGWIPRTKASDAELWCLLFTWINGWVNYGDAGDLRRHRAHDDVTVMIKRQHIIFCWILC